MSWQALQWALDCDKYESVTEWAVLIALADHADKRGYTWPSKKFIALRCRLHHASVARAISALIAGKLIFRTKKRRGKTGQVEVFRMPKSCWESGLKSEASKAAQSGHKASHKVRTRCLKSETNLDTDNQEPISSDNTLRVASTSGKQTNTAVSVFFPEGYQYQKLPDQPARDHIKWPEFAAWCRTKRNRKGQPGTPTETGFWKWLCGQTPQWRNKVSKLAPETGCVLDGKFLTQLEAEARAKDDPTLLDQGKFRKAIRRNGKIIILPNKAF